MNAAELVSYFYQMEMNDYFTYMEVSKNIKDRSLSEKIKKIALMEKEHAGFWAEFLKKRGLEPPQVKINRLKTFLIKSLSKIINPVVVISFLELGESGAIKNYYSFLKTEDLSEEERNKLKKIRTK